MNDESVSIILHRRNTMGFHGNEDELSRSYFGANNAGWLNRPTVFRIKTVLLSPGPEQSGSLSLHQPHMVVSRPDGLQTPTPSTGMCIWFAWENQGDWGISD